jgi:hypothetical protein
MGAVKKLLVFLIVVSALLVAADRAAAWEAGQVLADRLARAYQFDQPPDVQVQGIPFLTQWSSGQYQEVDVRAPTVTYNKVSITNLSAQLHTVTTAAFATSSADLAGATVREVDVQALLPYASLTLPQGLQVAPQGNQLRLTGSISVRGVSVPVSATVTVGVRNGSLQLTTAQLNVPSAFTRLGLASLVDQQLQAATAAFQLPLGAHLDAVSVTPTGLQASASATQVQLPR